MECVTIAHRMATQGMDSFSVCWLKKYSRRALCIDDTFDLTAYKLGLSRIIVVDEWDIVLPCAYLLSHRMTQREVSMLFEKIRSVHPTLEADYIVTDDTDRHVLERFQQRFPVFKSKKAFVLFPREAGHGEERLVTKSGCFTSIKHLV